jgi:predicted alpha/beta hydrolase
MPEAQTIRVRSGDGAEADLQLSQTLNSRVGLLWLPALGVSARNYLGFANALAVAGITVAVHEWRGAGSSSLRASRQCDWGYRELLEFDIPASFDAARSALPDARWIVGGHSIGGQLACLHAASNAHGTDAIALVASGSPYWKTLPSRTQWLARLIPPAVNLVTSLCGYYPGKRLGFAGTESRRLMNEWAQCVRTGRYSPYVKGVDFENDLREYDKQVLSIQLGDDSLCPQESRDYLLAKFAEADIKRHDLRADDFENKQASHFSWMKEPGPVAGHIAEWVHQLLEQGDSSPVAERV